MILRRYESIDAHGASEWRTHRHWTAKGARRRWRSTVQGACGHLRNRDHLRRIGYITPDEYRDTQLFVASLHTVIMDRRTGEVIGSHKFTDQD